MIIPMLGLGACAAGLTPVQERAWDAFKDCQRQAPSAMLQPVSTTSTPTRPSSTDCSAATSLTGSG